MLFSTITLFFILTGFDRTEKINISDIETTIIKAENVLRYDIKLKNSRKTSFLYYQDLNKKTNK
ncbi:hypothetical protein J6TS2_38030 [Heyndrickxia sporothermodurans]|nr:hypothetical protein J6TS2_38030 [Heyndrickxia sporothermodurans]